MPLRPLAIAFVIICLTLALWPAIGAVRGLLRRRWAYALLAIPALGLIGLAALPIPYIFGLDAPHSIFNGPAPVPSDTLTYYYHSQPSPTGGQTPELIALRADTGRPVWQRATPGQFIYVAQGADALYAVSSSTGTIQRSQLSAIDGATGSLLWQRLLPDTVVWSAPLASSGALLLSVNIVGSPATKEILALRPTDGQELWHTQVDAIPGGGSPQLVAGPNILYEHDRSAASKITARSLGDGKLLWSRDWPDSQGGRVVAGPDVVYEISFYGAVSALAAQTGEPLWTFGDHDFYHAAAFAGDTLYVTAQPRSAGIDGAARHPETVYALDAHTGALRWKFATKSANSGYLVATGNAVFIQADDGIHVLRPADGAVLWHSPAQTNWTFSAFSPIIGSVLYLTAIRILPSENLTLFGRAQGQVYLSAVNAANGAVYWSVPAGPVITIYPHFVI